MPVVKPLISIATAVLVAAGVYAKVGDPALRGPLADVERAVVGTVEKGLGLLSTAFDAVLPYRLPEVLPNGDIIIRYHTPPPRTPSVPENELPVVETSDT